MSRGYQPAGLLFCNKAVCYVNARFSAHLFRVRCSQVLQQLAPVRLRDLGGVEGVVDEGDLPSWPEGGVWRPTSGLV